MCSAFAVAVAVVLHLTRGHCQMLLYVGQYEARVLFIPQRISHRHIRSLAITLCPLSHRCKIANKHRQLIVFVLGML